MLIENLQVLLNIGKEATRSRSNKAKPDVNKPPTMIVVVLQDNTADIKKQVKRWGDIGVGVPTQCVVGIDLNKMRLLHKSNKLLSL